MRILFVSYSPLLGGAERILLDMAGAFDEPCGLVCPDGALAGAARAAGMRVLGVRARSLELRVSVRDRVSAPARLAAFTREVRAAIETTRPEVVVGWSMRAGLAAAAAVAAARPQPALVFQHNDLLPGPAVATAVRLAARRAERVIALSQAIADDLDPRRRLGDRLSVVHPGVDLDRFAAAPPAAAPEILTLGAIVPWKRPDLALAAVAIAARTRPDLRLTFAGAPIGTSGERLLERLRRRAAAPDLAGRVAFAGPVDDPRPLLRRAACLLHAAEREPFGMALVEALASARPAVAAASAGPLEIVDRACGRLFAPGDAAAAADALRDALDRRDVLAPACRARAEERFSLADARRRWRAAVGL